MNKYIKNITMSLLLFSLLAGAACGGGDEETEAEGLDTTTLALLFLGTGGSLSSPSYRLPTKTQGDPPQIRFQNSSGFTESYTIYDDAGCTNLIRGMSENPVANGNSTGYETLPAAGSYYISYDGGTSCSSSFYFSNDRLYSVTSGATSYSAVSYAD